MFLPVAGTNRDQFVVFGPGDGRPAVIGGVFDDPGTDFFNFHTFFSCSGTGGDDEQRRYCNKDDFHLISPADIFPDSNNIPQNNGLSTGSQNKIYRKNVDIAAHGHKTNFKEDISCRSNENSLSGKQSTVPEYVPEQR